MYSKKDKAKFIYILILISYILCRYFSIELFDINDGRCDMLILYSIPLFIWYINCYKNFTMTRERLKKYVFNAPLEYCTYEYSSSTHKRRIYVRIPEYNAASYEDNGTWYELDYDKTISKDSYLNEYNKFIQSNPTVMDLAISMDKKTGNSFKEVDYKFFKIASFVAIVVLILIHMLCTK